MEQLALFHESEQLFRRASDHAWFSVNQRRGDRLREDIYPVAHMPVVLGGLDYSTDTYISQHSYRTPQRRLASLSALSCAHLDLDFYKSTFAGLPVPYVVEQALKRCQAEGIPLPSMIIDSGRGIYLKWLWTIPLRSTALPRWQAVERALVKSFLDFEADGKATLGTQILRIEGSKNTKCGRKVGPVWHNGPRENPARHDFDQFCDLVLPYTRAQARAYKSEMAERGRYLDEIKSNLALRDAMLGRSRKTVVEAPSGDIAEQIKCDLVGELHSNRYDFLLRLVNYRHGPAGVPDGGCRDEFCWEAANALAWQTKAPAEILCAVRQLVPSYTVAEAKSSAAAVLNRLESGRELYKISNKTLIERLAVTDGELAALGSPSGGSSGLARSARPNEGVLRPELDAELGVMRGLSFDQYIEQTRERQRLGAQYVNNERKADTQARIMLAVADIQRTGKKVTVAAVARAVGISREHIARNHRDLVPSRKKV